MAKVLLRRICLLFTLLTLLPSATTAEYLHQAKGAVVLAAGSHCDTPPDEIVSAPNAKDGYVERHAGDYVFVVEGDSFPAQKSLGVGVRVVIAGHGPGSPLTVQTWSAHDGASTWEVRVDPDGEVEFGTLPSDGQALRPGRYLLSVFSKGEELLTYGFLIQGEVDDRICLPSVS